MWTLMEVTQMQYILSILVLCGWGSRRCKTKASAYNNTFSQFIKTYTDIFPSIVYATFSHDS